MFECANHPGADAVWLCNGCEKYLCNDCSVIKRYSRTDVETCKGCGDMVTAVRSGITMTDDDELAPLSSAFSFPFKGMGPYVLLGGTLVVAVVAIFNEFVAWSLFLGYGMTIIRSTSAGRDQAPDWPEVETMGDIVKPMILAFGVTLVSFGPAFYLSTEGFGSAALVAAVVAGAVYAPMAWIAASISERFMAITPITVIPLLARVNANYWVACGLLLATVIGGALGTRALGAILPGFVSDLVTTAALLYFVMVLMRILGLVWYNNREELGLS